MGATPAVAATGHTRMSWPPKPLFHSRMTRTYALLAGLILSQSSHAGTITGTIRAQGKEGADQEVAAGKYDSRKFKFVERINYAELHDFIVYIDQPSTNRTALPAKPVQVVTKKRVSQKG